MAHPSGFKKVWLRTARFISHRSGVDNDHGEGKGIHVDVR